MMIMIRIMIITTNSDRTERRNLRLFQSPHCAANCLQHTRSSGHGAIVCKSRATNTSSVYHVQHIVCHVARRDSSAIKFGRVEIAFILALFSWMKPLTDEEGEETGVSGENP